MFNPPVRPYWWLILVKHWNLLSQSFIHIVMLRVTILSITDCWHNNSSWQWPPVLHTNHLNSNKKQVFLAPKPLSRNNDITCTAYTILYHSFLYPLQDACTWGRCTTICQRSKTPMTLARHVSVDTVTWSVSLSIVHPTLPVNTHTHPLGSAARNVLTVRGGNMEALGRTLPVLPAPAR